MDASTLKHAFLQISQIMAENKDYLISLDQRNGDGDLGLSMASGFSAASDYLCAADETDLGRLMMQASSVFNETAPSTLGTILSFAMMGMALSWRGKNEASLAEAALAMQCGVDKIMEKTGAKPGEKTVLDALCPGIDALAQNAGLEAIDALKAAAGAARAGAESTMPLRAVHGRAAYYGEKSIGHIDGGAVAGSLIFAALYALAAKKTERTDGSCGV